MNTAGEYTATTTVDGCSSPVATITAAPKTSPATPVITVVNNCGGTTLSTTAAGTLHWSTGAASTSIITQTAGTFTLTTSANGCTSQLASATAAPLAIPAAPQASITQPTCAATTGRITVTSSKAGLSFSLNGSAYNTTGIFTGVAPGTYSLTATNSSGCVSSSTSVVISAANCASIGDLVFNDLNANGLQDTNEPGLASVMVKLRNSQNAIVATTTTATNGTYSFSNLAAGIYSVVFTTPAGYAPTLSNVGTNDTKDSDPVDGVVAGISLAANSANTTIDAGFATANLQLGNMVWYDANNNGKIGKDENGIANITLRLYRDVNYDNVADGAPIATTVTDAHGNYAFAGIIAGNYIVGAVLPPGYINSKFIAKIPTRTKTTITMVSLQ